jgi:hypothetical protein
MADAAIARRAETQLAWIRFRLSDQRLHILDGQRGIDHQRIRHGRHQADSGEILDRPLKVFVEVPLLYVTNVRWSSCSPSDDFVFDINIVFCDQSMNLAHHEHFF